MQGPTFLTTAASAPTAAPPARRPIVVRKPQATAGWEQRGPAPVSSDTTAHGATTATDTPVVRQAACGQGKAGPSAAERSVDLRAAYRARMAAMRTSRVGGARRQARNMPEPTEQHEAAPMMASAEAAPEARAPAPLGLSRSQRKRLARSARSASVLDAALSRAGISDPVSRTALADAISQGVGDGSDAAIFERVSHALAKPQ